jgi:hypothetical protein
MTLHSRGQSAFDPWPRGGGYFVQQLAQHGLLVLSIVEHRGQRLGASLFGGRQGLFHFALDRVQR